MQIKNRQPYRKPADEKKKKPARVGRGAGSKGRGGVRELGAIGHANADHTNFPTALYYTEQMFKIKGQPEFFHFARRLPNFRGRFLAVGNETEVGFAFHALLPVGLGGGLHGPAGKKRHKDYSRNHWRISRWREHAADSTGPFGRHNATRSLSG